MKECPKCKEVYPDYADTCPECYIDLDTGEKREIDKDIDVQKLKEAYKAYKDANFKVKVGFGSWVALIIVWLLLGLLLSPASMLGNSIVLGNIFGWVIMLSPLILLVMFYRLFLRINALFEALGEKSPAKTFLTWIFPFLLGNEANHKAKEILKRDKEAS